MEELNWMDMLKIPITVVTNEWIGEFGKAEFKDDTVYVHQILMHPHFPGHNNFQTQEAMKSYRVCFVAELNYLYVKKR